MRSVALLISTLTVLGLGAARNAAGAGPTPALLFTSDHENRSALFRIEADGANRSKLREADRGESLPAWSPDGKKLAYQHWDKVTQPGTLCVLDLETGAVTVLAQTGSWLLGRPAWRPG